MTVQEDIIQSLTSAIAHRLQELKRLTAPQMIIDNCQKQLDEGVKVNFQDDLDVDFVSKSTKTGRGGKRFVEYVLTDGRKAFFFPNGRFGAFAKLESK